MYQTQLPGPMVLTRAQNGMPIVTTPSSVDMVNEDEFERELLAAAALSQVVVVDAATTFFSVKAMRTLNDVGRMMADGGGELRVVIVKPGVRYHLEVAKCHRRLRIFPSLRHALRAPQQDRRPQLQAA